MNNFFEWLNIFSRLNKLEKRQMATEQELDQGLQELRNAIATKDGELRTRFQTLTDKITALEAAVAAAPGINLDDEFEQVRLATAEVNALLSQPVTPPTDQPV